MPSRYQYSLVVIFFGEWHGKRFVKTRVGGMVSHSGLVASSFAGYQVNLW